MKSRKFSSVVTLTDNEYAAARRYGKKYFLYIVVSDNEVWIVRNPARCILKRVERIEWEVKDWKDKGKIAQIN